MHSTRRSLLATTALLPIMAACSAVTTTTTNGVTTITVDVAKIDAWGTAFANAASLILDLPGVVNLPAGVAITAILAVIKTDLAAFDAAAGGNVTLSFDSTSVPGAIQSVLADGKTLLSDVAGVPGAVPATAQATANTYVQALETVVSVFAATIGEITAAAAPGGMTETTALKTLGVK